MRFAAAIVLTLPLATGWAAAPLLAQAPAAPLSLEAAIAEALQQSPALEPARESMALAEIGRERAGAEFGFRIAPAWSTSNDPPGMRTQFGVAIERRLPTGTQLRAAGGMFQSPDARSSDWTRGYSFAVVQPLLAPFNPATRAGVRDAERGLASARRAAEQARRDLVVHVAQAYFAVVRQQRLADASERALRRAEQLRDASQARTEVGLATKLDVLRADLLASQARAQRESQLEALADQRDQLRVLLGRPLDSPIHVDASAIAAVPDDAPHDPEALLTSALDGRLDVLEMRDRIGDARRAASIARWNLIPDVTIEARYAGRASTAGDPFEAMSHGWRVRLSTAYAFDPAGARAAVAAAEIATRAAERRLADVERAVDAEVRRASRAAARAAATIDIQQKAVAFAEQQLALAQMRYERGLAGNFDVVDAEANLFQAETALIAAQVERALARLVLENAAGRLDPGRYLR